MEQIARVPDYPQTKQHVPSLWLPRYLMVVLILVGGFLIPLLGIRVLGKDATVPDPVVAVADILSAQSESDLQARGFICDHTHDYVNEAGKWCVLNPPTGMFSSIAVLFVEGVSHKWLLQMRENSLKVGDLINLWGRPRIHQHDNWGQLDWHSSGDMNLTVSYKGRYSLFLPVGSFMFMGVGLTESGL